MAQNKLDELDRNIIYELDLDSSQSYVELGKKLGEPNETIAFRVKRLVDRGYIKGFITIVNFLELNSHYFKIFYKFQNVDEGIEKRIIDWLSRHPRISYLAEVQGRYDLVCAPFGKDMHDLESFLNEFKKEFGRYLAEQEIMPVIATHRFNTRFCKPDGQLRRQTLSGKGSSYELDAIETKIIKELARNSRIKVSDLAIQLGMSITAINNRISALRRKDILCSAVLDIDFEKFGKGYYQIDISGANTDVVNGIVDFFATMPEAFFATRTLGKYDLALEMVLSSDDELNGIAKKIKDKFGSNIIALDTFKLKQHSINWFPGYNKRR